MAVRSVVIAAQFETVQPEVAVISGTDWLKLIWRKPSSVNKSQHYNVTYVPTDGSSVPLRADNLTSNSTHFQVTLESLTTDTEYRVDIAFLTASGQVSTVTLIGHTLYIPPAIPGMCI